MPDYNQCILAQTTNILTISLTIFIIIISSTNAVIDCTSSTPGCGIGETISCDDTAPDCIINCNDGDSCDIVRCTGYDNTCKVSCNAANSCAFLDFTSYAKQTILSCETGGACDQFVQVHIGDAAYAQQMNFTWICDGNNACRKDNSDPVLLNGLHPDNEANIICKDTGGATPSCDLPEVDCNFASAKCQVDCQTTGTSSCAVPKVGDGYNLLGCFDDAQGTTCNIVNYPNVNFEYYTITRAPAAQITPNPTTPAPTTPSPTTPAPTTPAPTTPSPTTPSPTTTKSPTVSPTDIPSQPPTNAPSGSPSQPPTDMPSESPSMAPTFPPTNHPSTSPSAAPSDSPSDSPTPRPTYYTDTNGITSNYVLNSNFGINNFKFPAAINQCMNEQFGSNTYIKYECIDDNTAIHHIYTDPDCSANSMVADSEHIYNNSNETEFVCDAQENTFVEMEIYSKSNCPLSDSQKTSIFMADGICVAYDDNDVNNHYRLYCNSFTYNSNSYDYVNIQYFNDECSIYGYQTETTVEDGGSNCFIQNQVDYNIFKDGAGSFYLRIIDCSFVKIPTNDPTDFPTNNPTQDTSAPSHDPTTEPTSPPTFDPTMEPTFFPSSSPSPPPTNATSVSPSIVPSISPTNYPITPSPVTSKPSSNPTARPTFNALTHNISSNYVMNSYFGINNFRFPAAINRCMNEYFGSDTYIKYECIDNNTAQHTIYSDNQCLEVLTDEDSTYIYNHSIDEEEFVCDGQNTFVELELYSTANCFQSDSDKTSIFIADGVCTYDGEHNDSHYRVYCDMYTSSEDDNIYPFADLTYFNDECSIYGFEQRLIIEDGVNVGDANCVRDGTESFYVKIVDCFMRGYDEDENEDDQGEDEALSGYDLSGFVVAGAVIILPVLFIFIAFMVHRKRKGSDNPGYVALFKFFSSVGDFYTDAIWSLTLYSQGHELFIWAFIFTFGPHVLSILIGLSFITTWRQMRSKAYISDYAARFDKVIIILTLLSGFYNAVELITSHLFHLDLLSLQISQKQRARILNLKIINNVVLENIPCFIIQYLYLLSTSETSIFDNGVNITLLAMAFSTFAIVWGVITVSFRLFNGCIDCCRGEGSSNFIYLDFALKEVKPDTIKNHHVHTHFLLAEATRLSLQVQLSQVNIIYIQRTSDGIKVSSKIKFLDSHTTKSILQSMKKKGNIYINFLREIAKKLRVTPSSIVVEILDIRSKKDDAVTSNDDDGADGESDAESNDDKANTATSIELHHATKPQPVVLENNFEE